MEEVLIRIPEASQTLTEPCSFELHFMKTMSGKCIHLILAEFSTLQM